MLECTARAVAGFQLEGVECHHRGHLFSGGGGDELDDFKLEAGHFQLLNATEVAHVAYDDELTTLRR